MRRSPSPQVFRYKIQCNRQNKKRKSILFSSSDPVISSSVFFCCFFVVVKLPCFTLYAPCHPLFALTRPMHIVKLSNIPSKLKEKGRNQMLFLCAVLYIARPGAPSETLSERLMRSCARQRLVAASSRRTEEKVASRSGSGRH